MSVKEDRNKWNLPMEFQIFPEQIWKRVNSNMEGLLKLENSEDIKTKADSEEWLNALPELLNVLAKICKTRKH